LVRQANERRQVIRITVKKFRARKNIPSIAQRFFRIEISAEIKKADSKIFVVCHSVLSKA